MTIIEQIKAEIERRLKKYATDVTMPLEALGKVILELKGILSFISTLESEKPMNPSGSSEIPKELKEASEKEYPCDKSWMTDSMLDMNAHCQVAFWKGAKWQKEQMMKEAVEGKIIFLLNGDVAVNIGDTDKYNLGQKIRVIVLPKEDEK